MFKILQLMIRKKRFAYLKLLNRKAKAIRTKKILSLIDNFSQAIPPQEISNQNSRYQNVQIIDFNNLANIKEVYGLLAQRKPYLIVNGPQPSYLCPKTVKVIITKPVEPQAGKDYKVYTPYTNEEQSNSNFMQIPFDQFIFYQGQLQLSIAQMSLDKKQVIIPMYVDQYFTQSKGGITFNSIESINLWYYKGERISTWHYDGHDNFLFVKQGVKQVFIMSPNLIEKEFMNNGYYFKSRSAFDVNWNHALQPRLIKKNRQVYAVTVNPGQCLFLPRGWWHFVHSFQNPNIAINIWGNSIKQQIMKGQQDLFLRHIIFEVCDNLAKQSENWESLTPEIKEKIRQILFKIFFEKFLGKHPLTNQNESNECCDHSHH